MKALNNTLTFVNKGLTAVINLFVTGDPLSGPGLCVGSGIACSVGIIAAIFKG